MLGKCWCEIMLTIGCWILGVGVLSFGDALLCGMRDFAQGLEWSMETDLDPAFQRIDNTGQTVLKTRSVLGKRITWSLSQRKYTAHAFRHPPMITFRQ